MHPEPCCNQRECAASTTIWRRQTHRYLAGLRLLLPALCLVFTDCRGRIGDVDTERQPELTVARHGRHAVRSPIEPAARRRRPHDSEHHRETSGQASVEPSSDNPWASPEACETLLAEGRHAVRKSGHARLASWNVHWFPDGVPGHARSDQRGTDLRWFACIIAWLDLDALALEEVKSGSDARQKIDRVIGDLEARTHASWTLRQDECGHQQGQHVAWLTAGKRVQVLGVDQYDAINPEGAACARQLRPGLGVALKFAGGLDLQAIAVHLKSGAEQHDIELRRRSWAAVSEVMALVAKQTHDTDVLVLGDFNSMGCSQCVPKYSARDELSDLDRRLQSGTLPARRVTPDLPCSHYFKNRPGLLDQVVVSAGMRELPSDAKVVVEGYCKSLNCASLSDKEPLAHHRLSDHCPIVVNLMDRDLD
jgi:endonuclease/exonuclease/phosphatase family metal-dependent hydrolase